MYRVKLHALRITTDIKSIIETRDYISTNGINYGILLRIFKDIVYHRQCI